MPMLNVYFFQQIGQNRIGISNPTLYLQSFLWINHVVDYFGNKMENSRKGNNKLGELNPFFISIIFSRKNALAFKLVLCLNGK